MTNTDNEKKTKFNPWPIGLMLSLLAFCTIEIGLVTIATTTFEGLEDVEYYRHGIEYGKEIERQEKQKSLEWTIDHNLDEVAGPLDKFPMRVALLDYDKKPINHAKLEITVGRTATMKEDKVYEFKQVAPGVYASDVAFKPGKWRLALAIEKGDNIVKVDFRHEFKVEKSHRVDPEEIVTQAIQKL